MRFRPGGVWEMDEEESRRTVHPLVDVHGAVPKVLPGVEEAHGQPELEAGDQQPVDGLGDHQLPGGKGRDGGARDVAEDGGGEERIVPAGQGAGQERVGGSHVLGDGGGVESERSEDGGEGALGEADTGGPDGDVIVLGAGHLARLGETQKGRRRDLDDLLDHDVPGDLVARRQVALADLLGGVQAVLREEVVDVDDVEGRRHEPVRDVRQDERQPEVGDEGQKVGYRPGLEGRKRRERRRDGCVGHGCGGGREARVDGEAGRCTRKTRREKNRVRQDGAAFATAAEPSQVQSVSGAKKRVITENEGVAWRWARDRKRRIGCGDARRP